MTPDRRPAAPAARGWGPAGAGLGGAGLAGAGLGGAASELLGAAVGAGAAGLAWQVLRRRPPGGTRRWARTNYRGGEVCLLEGVAAVIGGAAAIAVTGGRPRRATASAAATVLCCGALGLYDDLSGSATRRGFAGHLGALRHGEVTSGTVKIVGIGATALGAALLIEGPRWRVVPATVVVAGSANLLNLLDLRPGRALKTAGVAAALLTVISPGPLPGVVLGVGGALMPADLGETGMLGDCGANALGGLLGAAAVATAGGRGLVVLAGGLVVLTGASERVSFSAVIAGNPVLRLVDEWGRVAVSPART